MHQLLNVPAEPIFQPCDAASEAGKETNLFDENALSYWDEVYPFDLSRVSPGNSEEFLRIS